MYHRDIRRLSIVVRHKIGATFFNVGDVRVWRFSERVGASIRSRRVGWHDRWAEKDVLLVLLLIIRVRLESR
jgi:hypothetical protein